MYCIERSVYLILKDVGMTAPKSIYAARQGMRACNNTNICNPKLKM